MSILDEVSKRDEYWRKLALQICGCPDLADDLVQDMYVKISSYKKANSSFIYKTIKNIFIDYLRSKREVSLEDWHIKNDNSSVTQDRYALLEMIDSLHWFEREILLITHEMSLRKAEKETGITYGKLNYHKTKGLSKLKEKYGQEDKRI